MLHAGLDLSRKKVDVCLLSDEGEHLDQLIVPPEAGSLRALARRIEEVHAEPVCAVIESMTGARLVHDTLEQEGWSVEIADAQKVKGLAPFACKTDRIDSMVLAVLSHRNLVPAIWLPDPRVREERELARFRLHLVKHRSMLKHRIHSTLINFGRPSPVSDLFGVKGRKLLGELDVPEPWRGNVAASLELIDDLTDQIDHANQRLRAGHADHPYVPLLMSAPGIGWVLAFTIAAEIGEIERFASPAKLTGYTGLCPLGRAELPWQGSRVSVQARGRLLRPAGQGRASRKAARNMSGALEAGLHEAQSAIPEEAGRPLRRMVQLEWQPEPFANPALERKRALLRRIG